jgi:hypothetical protein
MYESTFCDRCGCGFDRSAEGASIIFCPDCTEAIDAEQFSDEEDLRYEDELAREESFAQAQDRERNR